ncbi:MAG TPA: hypothetical protein VMT69_17650 [Kineosporiaceae bacterium]|nr:hypothetical protein [Kineosporiaceae bacterium]
MDPARQSKGKMRGGALLRRRDSAGFTLFEVFFAAFILCMMAVGVYAILLQAYQTSALARYRDDARAVLRTFADQFERLQTADPATNYRRAIFTTSDATGQGLRYWDSSVPSSPGNGLCDQASNDPAIAAEGAYLLVNLGAPGSQVAAKVTRTVYAINPGPSAVGSVQPGGTFPQGTDPIYAAHNLWLGTFTITYPVDPATGNPIQSRTMRVQTQTISVLRTP